MTDGQRYRRRHKTRTSVRVTEFLSRWIITSGGIGTIFAVCGVFVFLVWTVMDLFRPAEVGAATSLASDAGDAAIAIGSDEYGLIGWRLGRRGHLDLVRMFDDSLIERRNVVGEAARVTAIGNTPDGRDFVLGLDDGRVVLLTVAFETEFREADDVSSSLRKLDVDQAGPTENGVAQRTPLGQFRLQTPRISTDGPHGLAPDGGGFVAVQRAEGYEALVLAGITEDGRVFVRRRIEAENFLGEVEKEWEAPAQIELVDSSSRPRFAALTDFGTNLSLIGPEGELQRYRIRNPRSPELVETRDVRSESGAGVSALDVLLGGSTLLVGHGDGALSAWFVHPDESSEDGMSLARSREFEALDSAAITCFASSSRMRMFLVGDAGGTIRSYYMTSGKLLAELHSDSRSPIRSVAFAPKSDAVLAGTDTQTWHWPFTPKHADASMSALFGKVWYERYEEPTYTWQSSSADDAFEPKISLIPLVFGTIKATFYSMLIGLPLAILAAIYTSEFLRGRLKSVIKPTVETMASLPSVVLGFLAAVVIAPVVAEHLADVLAAFVTVPFAILLGAHLAQALPPNLRWRADKHRLSLNGVAAGLGLLAAGPFGAMMESWMFAGSAHEWLDGQIGDPVAGWMILLLPVAILIVTLVTSLYVTPWLRRIGGGWSSQAAGSAHLVKFVAASAAVVVVAFTMAWIMPGDLREGVELGAVDISPIQTFDPRNALVVGFMMGFAVIPIMYTIAEDALSSVPSHLRAAALGAGATSWQTAWRVVVPTAMSGLFSASMVGLGRAVGETMIVLMAAGNTAVLDMNIFSGFRTLSANIATELPESVRDSTHYKTLFLAALVLFAMTFLINTIAESVRLRFRRRAFQL